MEMAFVHPWQKDPSPSASREHSYSIYRKEEKESLVIGNSPFISELK